MSKSSGRIKIGELKTGDTFTFDSPGFHFGKCLFVGIDAYTNVNFIHLTAGGDRYLLNNLQGSDDPYVIKDVTRSPLRPRVEFSE